MPARIDGPRISRARPLGRRVEVGRVAVLLSVGIGAFAIDRVNKTFIAALMLQLAEEGKLSLDAPLPRWLPKALVPYRVTLGQMLDHTSGLYDFFSNPTIDAALMADNRRTWTHARSLS